MLAFGQNLQQILDKGQGDAVRVLDKLPKAVQESFVKLLGYPYQYPQLDPLLKCLMAVQVKQGWSGFIGTDVQRSRQQFEQKMQQMQGKPTAIAWIEDLRLPLPSGAIFARHYHPAPTQKLPLIVFYHGGGFVMGSIETHDEVCRLLAEHAKVQVLSIDYPLAPEVGPQRLIQSCEEALAWVYQNREQFQILKNRIAVAGDSAGANISTVIAQRCAGKAYAPQAQLLIYPTVDFKSRHLSFYRYQHGLMLTGEDVDQVTEFYATRHQIALDDPLISPTYGRLEHLAPAFVVTTGHDLLHDEAVVYVHKLRQYGVVVHHQNYLDQTHGFINLAPVSRHAKKYLIEIAKNFRKFWNKQV